MCELFNIFMQVDLVYIHFLKSPVKGKLTTENFNLRTTLVKNFHKNKVKKHELYTKSVKFG
jgi:hypothetical protein